MSLAKLRSITQIQHHEREREKERERDLFLQDVGVLSMQVLLPAPVIDTNSHIAFNNVKLSDRSTDICVSINVAGV